MIILGVDPGGTTGAALLSVPEPSLVMSAGLTLTGVMEQMRRLVEQADAVAVERYTISGRTLTKSRQPDAMYVIGMMQLLCHEANVPMKLQLVADAKPAYSDQALRDVGVWHPVKHVRDATRHALLFARRAGFPT